MSAVLPQNLPSDLELSQLVRDLEWVMRSPSLWGEGPAIQDIPGIDGALARLRQDASSLKDFLLLHDRSGRLGNRFESLLLFCLTEILKWSPVHSSVAIREGSHTLGELDFVLPSFGLDGMPQTEWEHWEAAVKFYMCIAPEPAGAQDPASFVGQALLDRLDLKLAHLFEKQLRLGGDPRALPALQALGVSRLSRSRLFMKGRLYYPLEWNWREVPGPQGVAPGHERGWWIAWDEQGKGLLGRLSLEDGVSRWRVHPKSRWMAPPAREGNSAWGFESHEALFLALDEHFADPQAATLALTGHGIGMILKPGWPRSVTLSAP